MLSRASGAVWDFDSTLDLLKRLALSTGENATDSTVPPPLAPKSEALSQPIKIRRRPIDGSAGLGDFNSLWDYLQDPDKFSDGGKVTLYDDDGYDDVVEAGLTAGSLSDAGHLAKGVRWRDEVDGADLEDNVAPVPQSAATIRNQKRAKRRQRAKEKARTLSDNQAATTTDDAESDDDLDNLRRSPDRRALVASIIGRPLPIKPIEPLSPPTSPSPPKTEQRSQLRDTPVSQPFLWTAPGIPSPKKQIEIKPLNDFTPFVRKSNLIRQLAKDFPDERRFLSNSGLLEPAFSRLNRSDRGVHVFVDISNISIGFHDCLKQHRNIPITTRVRRVPLNFHNFSLVLERGRPAARRALAGSDKSATVAEAESLGYDVNILERVHKAKQLTPKQKKYLNRASGNGNASASGLGETSGSETNPGYLSSTPTPHRRHKPYHPYTPTSSTATAAATALAAAGGFTPSKWVEQGVDEILHLKILESVVDAKTPSTIVLATGDAAEAEYSAGFMRMVERALDKGWVVELVSFRLNTSSAYTRASFRNKWGGMFRWIILDDYVEFLIGGESVKGEGMTDTDGDL